MANGIKALRQIQLNREDVQGTATSDFTPWRGTGTLEDIRTVVFTEEDIGIFGGVDRQYVPKTGGQLVLESTPATFEQLPHIFDGGLYMTTSTTDASAAKIRTYTLPISSSDVKESTDLQTFSIKAGDNNEVEKASFGFVSEFSLSGQAGEALMVTATIETRTVSTDNDGFETVSIPTVEEILFSKGQFYVDATDTDFGVTEVSNTLISADLNVKTGWQAVDAANGQSYFAFLKQVQPEIVLDVVFEHNASAAAEKSAWRAGTARLIRLKFTGTALSDTDAGATYDTKTLIINLAGKWEKFEKLDERDGNDIVAGTFRARYNATAAKYAEFIIVNEVETMPG